MKSGTLEAATRFSLILLGLSLPLSIALTSIAIALVLATFLASSLLSRNLRWVRPPLLVPIGFYLLAATLSALCAEDHAVSFRDLGEEWIYPMYLLLFQVFKRHNPEPALKALGWGVALAALLGLLQVASSWGWIPLDILKPLLPEVHRPILELSEDRAHGAVHPVTYGEQMALGALFLLFRIPRFWPPAREGLQLVMATVALLASLTRGALLGFLAGLCTPSFTSGMRFRHAGILAGLVVLGAFLHPTFRARILIYTPSTETLSPAPQGDLSKRIESLAKRTEWSTRSRLRAWFIASQVTAAYPFFGAGLGHFAKEWETRSPQVGSWDLPELLMAHTASDAHSLYFQQAAERGLVGLAALLVLFGSMIRTAWKLERRMAPVFIGLAVFCLTESALQDMEIALLVLFLAAASFGGISRRPVPPGRRAGS